MWEVTSMTEFANKSFSVYPGKDGGQAYRDNWDRIYGKREERPETQEGPEPCCCREHFAVGIGCDGCPHHGVKSPKGP